MSALADLREEAEIAIVGAGPAGCTAAASLIELGHEVLLIDKHLFPREKPCGDAIGPPAVAAAKRMGLEDLIDASMDVESLRLVAGHRRHIPLVADRPGGRCVPRKEFDAALLSAARERGARFLHARVDTVEQGPGDQCLLGVAGEDRIEVRAGLVIAADGATSRMRRVVEGEVEKPTAYAIRRYFRAGSSLDPILQIDIPLEFDHRILPGYGWFFPIGEHTVNIGVGVYREAHRRLPPLRAVLQAYVSELEAKAARLFGELEPIGEPLGSPVGIRSQIAVADSPSLAFVGDAAGTTHPVSGEGISFAMRGGEELATAIHARMRRGSHVDGKSAAADVWRSFPQLGVDVSGVIRGSMRKLNKTPAVTESAGPPSEPFFVTTWRISTESAYEPGVEGTPAWSSLNSCDESLGVALERTNDLILDRLSDPTPFVTEVIHDSIRAHLGPMYAAVAIATAAGGQTASIPPSAMDAGFSVEAGSAMPGLLRMLVDRAPSKQLKLNNAMTVVTGDFAATRALEAAAKLGPAAVASLARACQAGCEGAMHDSVARFAADREIDNWLEAATRIQGAGVVVATEFGKIARGEDVAAARGLRQYGLELGIAIRLAEEIVELVSDYGTSPIGDGSNLSRGIYALPVLYAIESKPSTARLLAQHTAGQCDAREVLARVRETGALDRAVVECRERAEAARSLAEEWAGKGSEPLAALAMAPPEYVFSRMPVDALGAS